MNRKWHVGIDIGLKGAICVMEDQGNNQIKIDIHPMPVLKGKMDYHKLHELIEKFEGFNGHVVFEKLGVIYGTSKTTASLYNGTSKEVAGRNVSRRNRVKEIRK